MSFETKTESAMTKIRIELRQLRESLSNNQGSGTASPPASETLTGTVQIATQAETNAGTNDTSAVTPLKLQSKLVAFAQPLSASLTTLAGVVSGATGRALLSAATTGAAKTTLALVKADVGLGNVDNTSDATKPVSTPQQTALNLKADTSALPTKVSLGLGNVDNTSDLAKPVSTAQQTALNAKADTSALPTKTSLGLGNVDNTSDLAKPVSTAQQTALNLKADTSALPTKVSLGLGNVDNTSDVNKPVSTAQQTALNLKANRTDNLVGYGQLRSHGTYSSFADITDFGWCFVLGSTGGPNIPGGTADQYHCLSVSIGLEYPYSSHAYQIAYKRGLPGVVATRYRENGTWSAWTVSGPPTKADVGLGNVDNTSDANKPVSTAQQAALNLKADTSALPTKVSLGLGNVDNTSDVNKPVSTPQQTALNLKANKTELPTKDSLGLNNVDNIPDMYKPVSNPQKAALDLKAPLNSPYLSGTPVAPTAAAGTNTTQLATTEFVQTGLGTKANSSDIPTKTSLGLNNVDNTSDVNKPVSSAQQTALNLKADNTALASKANLAANLVGYGQLEVHGTYTSFASITNFGWHYVFAPPDGPNMTGGYDQYYCLSLSIGSQYDYSTYVCQIAYRRNVNNKMAMRFKENGVWGAWDVIGKQLTKDDVGLGSVDNIPDMYKPLSNPQKAALDLKAPLNSPYLTGIPVAPTAAAGTNTTQLATTEFVQTVVAPKAPLASPSLTGTPVAPTAAAGTNTTQLATTEFVQTAVAPKAPLASPSLTGTPVAPTAAAGTSSTQIATTAFVQAAVASVSSGVPSVLDGGSP